MDRKIDHNIIILDLLSKMNSVEISNILSDSVVKYYGEYVYKFETEEIFEFSMSNELESLSLRDDNKKLKIEILKEILNGLVVTYMTIEKMEDIAKKKAA